MEEGKEGRSIATPEKREVGAGASREGRGGGSSRAGGRLKFGEGRGGEGGWI